MKQMAKTICTVPFDYHDELNKFLNQHQILRTDIVDIRHHWNMGYDVFVLTFYADENLKAVINAQTDHFNKGYNRAYLLLFCVAGLFLLGTFIWWLWQTV